MSTSLPPQPGPFFAPPRDSAEAGDWRWGLLLLALLLGAGAALAFGGLTPLPLNQQEGMAPWSLNATHAPDPATWDSLWWDGVAQFLPWRWEVGDALRHGKLPLWSPWSFCGQPLLANGQSAALYPPVALCCRFLEPAMAIAVLWVIHLALAFVLTWLLARRLGCGHFGGAASGLIFATGGFMLAWAPVPSLIQSAAWLPGALYGVEEALHKRPFRGALILGLCLAASILAGHMQVAGYVWLTVIAWAAIRLFFRAIRHKPWPAVPILGGIVLGILLSAGQWLPTAELGRLSPRGGEKPSAQGFAMAQQLALQPEHLATLVWPGALGFPKTGTYHGFAFAEHFCGLGPLTFLLALTALLFVRHKWVFGMGATALAGLILAMGTAPAELIYFHLPFLGQTAGFQRTLFIFCLAWSLLAGLGLDRVLRGREGASRTAISAVLFALLLAQAVWLIGSVVPLSRQSLAARPTPVTDWLKKNLGPDDRVLAITPRRAWTLAPRPHALFPPNTLAPYGIRDVQGYDSLYPRIYREAAAKIERSDPSPLSNGNMILLENADYEFLGMLSVKYVLSDSPIGSRHLEKVTEIAAAGGTVYIYQPTGYLAGASLSPTVVWHLSRPTPLSAKTGYGTTRFDIPPTPDAEVEIAETPYPGWDAYLDGRPAAWSPYRWLPLVRLIHVPASSQTRRLDLVFEPTTVVLGLFLSLVALAAAVSLLFLVGKPFEDWLGP
jgi:hypothetical protein